MGLIGLRFRLRTLRVAIEDLTNTIKEHSETIETKYKTQRDKQLPIHPPNVIVSFDDKTVRQSSEQHEHQQGTQDSIKIAAWCAFIAALFYAAVAVFQWCGILEANRISHAALVATQRAYVTVTGLNIEQSNFNPKLVSYMVSPIIINSGNTPTKNLWWTAVWGTPPVDVANEPTEEDLSSATHNYGTFGARQEIRDLIKQPIPAEHATVLRQSYASKHIPIYGAIVYEDGISDPPIVHVRRYCYSLYVNPYFTPSNGFSYTACGGRSNCEDEECDEATQQQMKVIGATKRN